METSGHRGLKTIAMAFLAARGCRVMAGEVRCPLGRWRIDVAGFIDHGERFDESPREDSLWDARRREKRRPITVLIECKQSRSDFLRDRRDADRLLRVRQNVLDRIERVEQLVVKRREPHLRRSAESLFPEMEAWDFSASETPAYRTLMARLERVERQVYTDTKFMRMARYRLADRCYLLTPPGLVRARETPPGWGLLEGVPDGRDATVRVPAPTLAPPMKWRLRLLRNIAAAASARLLEREGVTPVRNGRERVGAVGDGPLGRGAVGG